jgi:gluconate 2-dehydrogenase gamma chain
MLDRRKFIQETVFGALGTGIIAQALGSAAVASPEGGFTVFTPSQAATVEAICGRIWPATEGDPGAVEAGVVFYIDRSLSDFYHELKDTYHQGIDSVNSYAMKKLGDNFANLPEERQVEILTNLEKNTKEVQPFFRNPSAPDFFLVVLKHTHEGLFSDPIYGGNRNFLGWKSIGYTGPRYFYTAKMQTAFAPLQLPIYSVANL